MNWLVGQTISRAEIHLNPPELGALQVRIDQRQDSTVVSIISQNATTRELLESNASRLKELFSDQGLELLDVEVNDGEQQAPSADPYSSADFAFVDAAKDERLSAESDFIANKEAANISGIVLRYGSVDTFV
jgi:flagellar hook-length control protein FliK